MELGTDEDRDQLRLLSIFHYVVAGILGLFSCIPIIHLTIGIAMLRGAFPNKNGPPEAPMVVGAIFVGGAALLMMLGWLCAIAVFVAGRYLAGPRHYTFCLIVAGIACLLMPFGTALGVFTIIVLMRPSVKAMFHVNDAVA